MRLPNNFPLETKSPFYFYLCSSSAWNLHFHLLSARDEQRPRQCARPSGVSEAYIYIYVCVHIPHRGLKNTSPILYILELAGRVSKKSSTNSRRATVTDEGDYYHIRAGSRQTSDARASPDMRYLNARPDSGVMIRAKGGSARYRSPCTCAHLNICKLA